MTGTNTFLTFVILGLCILEIFLSVPECEALAYANPGGASGKENGGPAGLKGPTNMNAKKSQKTLNSEASKIIVKNGPGGKENTPRVYNGVNTRLDYFAMLMKSPAYIRNTVYYGWIYASNALLMSETCVLARAGDLTDTTDGTSPPSLNTGSFGTVFVPRYGCDTQYHIENAYFNNPPYNEDLAIHDITMLKTKRPIRFGNAVCGGQSVSPAWISCDSEGPPPGYKDCFAVSYGQKNETLESAPEEIGPNKSELKTLSFLECDAVRQATGDDIVMNPKDQICVQTLDGKNPKCLDDHNFAVVCKYWKNTGPSNGWGAPSAPGWGAPSAPGWGSEPEVPSPPSSGWGASSSGWGSQLPGTHHSQAESSTGGWGSSHGEPNGWGSSSHQESHGSHGGSGWGQPSPPTGWDWSEKLGTLIEQNWESRSPGAKSGQSGGWGSDTQYVVVGHQEYYYGGRCPDATASLVLKYGSPTYKQLFSQEGCNFVCSSELKPGYKCRGNPSPSLGPVYCMAERVTDPGSGWSSK